MESNEAFVENVFNILDTATLYEIIRRMNPRNIITLCTVDKLFSLACEKIPWHRLLIDHFGYDEKYLDARETYILLASNINDKYYIIFSKNETENYTHSVNTILSKDKNHNEDEIVAEVEIRGLNRRNVYTLTLFDFEFGSISVYTFINIEDAKKRLEHILINQLGEKDYMYGYSTYEEMDEEDYIRALNKLGFTVKYKYKQYLYKIKDDSLNQYIYNNSSGPFLSFIYNKLEGWHPSGTWQIDYVEIAL